MKRMQYFFEEITHCEMCGDETKNHEVLGQRLNKSQGRTPKKNAGITVSVKKCTNCQLIYSSPQPIPFDIGDHYKIPPEEYWGPEYFVVQPDYFSDQIKTAKEKIGFQKGMTALDIGAGIGKGMIALEQAGFDVYGCEPSTPFAERAISQMGINPRKIKIGTVEDVQYNENSFDFINFGSVFEHLYHPAAALQKALGWLTPNGVIYVEVPSSKYLVSRIINAYYRMKGTNYVTNISPMHEPFHLYEFGEKSFEELGKKIGYRIDSFQYYVCSILLLPRIVHGILKWYMKRTNTGMQLVAWIKKK